MHWHILDTRSIWIKEFAAELAALVPATNWCPDFRYFGGWESWEQPEEVADPKLSILHFPMQRGYSRVPVAQLLPFAPTLVDRLLRHTRRPEASTLICTAPFYAPVAERWPGPVVYYLTDLTKLYAGMNPRQVVELDRRMCRVAQTICPNSRRIADYLRNEAECDPAKITVVPNATRTDNISAYPTVSPAQLPPCMAELPRPILGVIGNLASNIDWTFLSRAVRSTKDVSWVFVGPAHEALTDKVAAEMRRELMSLGGRVRFIGPKPYGELQSYARSFDAAVIPYCDIEPTVSGSATRFYEHLASGRPILATRAHYEVRTKEPLVTLVDDGDTFAATVEALRKEGFQDGLEELRWKASKEGTWRARAKAVIAAAQGDRSPANAALVAQAV